MSITREHGGEHAREPSPAADLVVLFGLGLAALFAHRSRRDPPHLRALDAVATGMATHAVTRALSAGRAAPARAPSEAAEASRGRGLRRALEDVLACPYCTGPWVALAMVAGWTAAPRATRLLTWALGAAAASDWLERAYQALGAARQEGSREPEVRFVRVRVDAEEPDDGLRGGVMTRHVEIHPDDVPEYLD